MASQTCKEGLVLVNLVTESPADTGVGVQPRGYEEGPNRPFTEAAESSVRYTEIRYHLQRPRSIGMHLSELVVYRRSSV